MKCIEPKKQIIAKNFLQRGSIEDVYSLSMEAILQKKTRTCNWKIYVAHLADCSLQTL